MSHRATERERRKRQMRDARRAALRRARAADVAADRQAERLLYAGLVCVAGLLAAGGWVWYVLSPGVPSYHAAFWLSLPLLGAMVWWCDGHLAPAIEWTLAGLLAVGGAAGYLALGGPVWWGLGKAMALPFALLVTFRAIRSRPPGTRVSEPWAGGMRDGPWGPP